MTHQFRRIAVKISLAAAVALLLVALYAAAGHWLAPRLLRDALDDFVRDRLGGKLELREVTVDPWRLIVVLSGVRMRARDGGELAALGRLTIELDAASLWNRTWQLREVVAISPRVEFLHAADGNLNWAAPLAELARGNGSQAPRVRVGRAAIVEGEIHYQDRSSVSAPELRAKKIALELQGFSTAGAAPARIKASTVLQDGATLAANASVTWPKRSAEGEVTVQGASAATLFRLVGSPVTATRGTVRASARYSFGGTAHSLVLDRVAAKISDIGLALAGGNASAGTISIEKGHYAAAEGSASFGHIDILDAAIEHAAVAGQGAAVPQAKLARLSLESLSVSIPDRVIRIDRALLSGINGTDELNEHNASRLAEPLTKPVRQVSTPADNSAAETQSATAWRVLLARLEAKDTNWRIARIASARSGSASLTTAFPRIAADALHFTSGAGGGITAERLQAMGGSLRFTQLGAGARAIELRDIALSTAQIRYPDGDPFKLGLEFALPPSGHVTAKGEFDPRGQSLSLEMRAQALPLAALQAWTGLDPALRLAAGTLDAEGNLHLAPHAAKPTPAFKGKLAAHGLTLQGIDSRAPIFSADTILANGVTVGLAPTSIAIDELALQAPVGRITIAAGGTPNIGASRPTDAGSRAFADPETRMPLAVRSITLHDGHLDFADLSIRPAFKVRIDELSGTVNGFDTARAASAEVALAGRVDEYGSAKIRGTLQPMAPGTLTDLTLELRNVDMTSLDPYSRRFAGYRIEAGKLSGELRYRARNGRLEGQNRLVFDKLKLGERVAGAQDSDLPLELAIALLTDADGRIEIEVPVSGDMQRPEFDLGKVIAQAISGAIGKIVSAPFRLLAGLFGGGEKAVDRILFEPGSAALDPPEREKIVAVARALAARPQLVLHVAAGFDGVSDADALRTAKVAVNPENLLALARSRGENVRQALRANGTDPGRIDITAPASVHAEAKHGVPVGLTLGTR